MLNTSLFYTRLKIHFRIQLYNKCVGNFIQLLLSEMHTVVKAVLFAFAFTSYDVTGASYFTSLPHACCRLFLLSLD